MLFNFIEYDISFDWDKALLVNKIIIVISTFNKQVEMELPVVRNDNVNTYLNHAEIVNDTAAQIMKDFGMFGVEITFSGDVMQAYDELHGQLTNQIQHLINVNYDKLLSVLYQVDITEREISQAEIDLPHYNQIEIIAHQVIVRELKKVLWRRYFKLKK